MQSRRIRSFLRIYKVCGLAVILLLLVGFVWAWSSTENTDFKKVIEGKRNYLKVYVPALGGEPHAQFHLGRLYRYGSPGVTRNAGKAFKWIRKAVDHGVFNAHYVLAEMYNEGEGVRQDQVEAAKWYRKAFKWYRKAADLGGPTAQIHLGSMYENGQGVILDTVEAYKWYVLSASSGSPKAAQRRDELASKMTPEQIAEADRRVVEWKSKHPTTRKW